MIFCELESLHLNTPSRFGFRIFNLQPEIPCWWCKCVLNLDRITNWSTYIVKQSKTYLHYPWETYAEKLRDRISLQTKNRMAVISSFRVGFPDQRCLASWTTLNWYIGYSTILQPDILQNFFPRTFKISHKSILGIRGFWFHVIHQNRKRY